MTAIGQPMFYYPGKFLGNVGQLDRDQPMMARVCYVHDDNMVNLIVVDHVGVTHSPCLVPIYKDGDKDKEGSLTGYAQLQPEKKAVKPEPVKVEAEKPAPFLGFKPVAPAPVNQTAATEPVKQPEHVS